MSLETGALKVSGVPAAMCREEVSMATLEAGTTQNVVLLMLGEWKGLGTGWPGTSNPSEEIRQEWG